MTTTKTDKEVEMEHRLDILGQALQQVCQERKEANDLAERWKLTSNYYFDRYHATRTALVRHRLDLKDASAMIETLLNPSGDKDPDIDIRDDDLTV